MSRMISLRKIFRKLRLKARPDTAAEAEEEPIASPLFRLPPEIILLIANMLPTPSIACLALSSRRMYYTLGSDSWKSLKTETPDVLSALLSLLAKDLPEHFICQVCTRIHRTSVINWPRNIDYRRRPPCAGDIFGYNNLFFSRFRINFPHIQLAIRQHLHGTDIGFPLEAFQIVEVEHDVKKQKVALLSADAQIVSNELLMRSQTWTLLPQSRLEEFIDNLAKDSLSTDICIHTRIGACKENRVSNLVRSRLDPRTAPWARGKRLEQTLQCSYCYMDFVFGVLDFGERGLAVVVTKWVNLGAGLDIEDAKWKSHLINHADRPVHHLQHSGDIQKAFEGQEELSLKELTLDNQMRLFSRRGKQMTYRGSDGLVWKWDIGRRWYLDTSKPRERSFLDFFKRP